MSRRLISRSPDLKRLRDEGYNVQIKAEPAHLMILDVPYVTANRVVETGVLVSTLALAGDVTTTPDTHVAFFAGEMPCDQHGQPLTKIINESRHQVLADGLEIEHSFSSKPAAGYPDYYEKMTAYINILLGPALAIDPNVTPQTYPVIEDDDDESVFRYLDTASSRAGIGAVTQKLHVAQIAIVGLGGTGSYVLDFVAKTPVREIHLFDGDAFLQHNAFRAPGAPTIETLQTKPAKVAYLSEQYSNMRNGIIAHPEYLDESNVDALRSMDFAFLCMAAGQAKRQAVRILEDASVSFVDVGMGLQETGEALGGIVRVTTSTPSSRDEARPHIPFSEGGIGNEYARNIQIAELNALNAALAVIKWKKLCGFYRDFENEYNSLYTIDGNQLLNEGGPDAG